MENLEILWPAVTFLVLYTGFLFAGFSWMLKSQIDPVKELLTNHITDTNKRFDDTNKRFDDTNKRFDDTNKRFDDTNKRFDVLSQEMKEGFKEIKEIVKR